MNPLLVLLIILVIACGVLFAIIRAQVKRADKAQAKAETLHTTLGKVTWKAERLQKALEQKTHVEVTANEERKALSSTADADLVHRANALFSGVQNDQRTGNR
jgi:preprotein translocase subunit YajC